jgi:hypothetical protein
LLVRALVAHAPEPALDLVQAHARAVVISPGRDRGQVVRVLVRDREVYRRVATCRISSTFRLAVVLQAVVDLQLAPVQALGWRAERSPAARLPSS